MSKRQKTLIPASSDFLSSLLGPTHKLLGIYANYPHVYDHVLLNLKHLNHANYDAFHRHIITSKNIKVASIADTKWPLKSSFAFEHFTILHVIDFCIDT